MSEATVYHIMHMEKCVAQVSTAGECKIHLKDFMPYDLVLEESDDFDDRINNVTNFYYWCASRMLTLDRTYAKEILNSIAVCNEMDDDVKERRNVGENKTAGKKGLVVQLEQYELYALTWADVFESFELRHSFLLDKLNMDREMIENELQKEVKEFEGREAINTMTTKLCARA